MKILPIVYAPNPIFKKKAEYVKVIDEEINKIAEQMIQTMYFENAIGLGANMVGVLKRIAVVDLRQNGEQSPIVLINPIITFRSKTTQTIVEASVSFPGIDSEITRPNSIIVEYQNLNGEQKELKAEGLLSSVIQHEVDYLDGIVFLDYLSKLKRDMLITKMQKYIKMHPPHVHGAHCHH